MSDTINKNVLQYDDILLTNHHLNDDPEKPVLYKGFKKGTSYNVLFVALSIFNSRNSDGTVCTLYRSTYTFSSPEENYTGEYYYQLTPIVQITAKRLARNNDVIDKVIILSTIATRENKAIRLDNTTDVIESSPLDFFKKQSLPWINPDVDDPYEVIDIDEDNPSEGISNTITFLRKLKPLDIHLHLSTHGGFRGIQQITEAIISLLKDEITISDVYSLKYTNSISKVSNTSEEFKIFDFVSGINECINYGRIGSLEKYLSGDKAILDPMRRISEGIQMCSIADFESGLSELAEYFRHNKKADDPYLELFKESLKADYGSLLDNYSALTALKWCLRKGLYQQALTLLESKMSEYLLENGVIKLSAKIKRNKKDQYTDNNKHYFGFNQLFNGCIHSFKMDKISSSAFNNMIFTDDGIKKHLESFMILDQPTIESKIKSAEDSSLQLYDKTEKGMVTVPIDKAIEFCEYKPDVLVLLYLHKTIKDIRNSMNHAKNKNYGLSKIREALSYYIELSERLCPEEIKLKVYNAAVRSISKAKRIHLSIPELDDRLHLMLDEPKSEASEVNYPAGKPVSVIMISSGNTKWTFREI